MELKKQKKYTNSLIIAVLLTLIFLTIVVILSNITIMQGIKYGLFIFFAEGMCGYVIVRLVGIKPDTQVQLLAFSLGLGYCLQIVNYYLLVPVGLRALLPYVIIVESLFAGIFLYLKRGEFIKYEESNKELVFFGLFLLIAFTFRFILGFGYSVVSYGNIVNTYNTTQDVFYHTENTISASYQFPLTNFRQYVMPNTLYYHYFTNIANSVTTYVCGIPIGNFECHLDLVRGVLLLSLSYYGMMQKICKNSMVRFMVSILTLFSLGNESATGINLVGHLFINPFGYDYGVSLSILFLILSFYIFENKVNIKLSIVAIVLCMAATGAKGPVFVVAAFAFAIEVIYHFFKRNVKEKISLALFSIGVFIAFILVFVFVTIDMSGNSVDVATHSLEFKFLQSLRDMYVWKYHDLLVGKGVPEFLGVLFTIAVWAFTAKPGLFLACCLAVFLLILKRVKIDLIFGMLFGASAFGCLLILCLTQSGGSERYFSMTGFIMLSFMTAHALSLVMDKCEWKNVNSCLPIVLTGVLVLFLLPGFKYWAYTCETEVFARGIDTIFCSSDYEEPNVEVMSSVRKAELQAYDWIRENTVFDDVFVNNIYLVENAERNYTPTAFSERRNWIDGWIFQKSDTEKNIVAHRLDILKKCLENDESAYKELKNDGVSYLVQITGISPEFVMNEKFGQIAYKNEDVIVYKLK